MLRTLTLAAALALAATSVCAQTIDAKGSCRDANGKMAKMALCKPTKARAAGPPNCKKGQACGNTCIPIDKVCHVRWPTC